jgi:hypothetical protein
VTTTQFEFDFSGRVKPAAALFGVTPQRSIVRVTDEHLRIRFGPWRLVTPLDNVLDATVTGPYSWWKVAGPPHLSLADRGITFATTTSGGVCITFAEPVAMRPSYARIRHPAATVTVVDGERLVELLGAR